MTTFEYYVGLQLLTLLYGALAFIFVLYPLTRGLGWSLFRQAVVAVLIGGSLAYLTMPALDEVDAEPMQTNGRTST